MKTKIVSVVLVTVLLCAACCFMSACPQKEKQYDFQIKVEFREWNKETKSYEYSKFEPLIINDEKHIEQEYDGKTYDYVFSSYNMPDHPRWSDSWLSPSYQGNDFFSEEVVYHDTDGNFVPYIDRICDKGTYEISYRYGAEKGRLKNKTIKLFVLVK